MISVYEFRTVKISTKFYCELVPWSEEYPGYERVEDRGEDERNHIKKDYVSEEQDLVEYRGARQSPFTLGYLNTAKLMCYNVVIYFNMSINYWFVSVVVCIRC